MNDDKEIKDILLEILRWTKFEGLQKVKVLLESTLNTDTKKIVYESSNGLSSPEIAQIGGIAPHTVRDYWKDWAILGIVEIHPSFKKRYRRIFSLKEVSIELPASKVSSNPKDAEEVEDEPDE
jgi:hypothetical protein